MTTLSGIITQGQLGMLSLNFFSTGPAQVLAVMGGMRWGGMVLAGRRLRGIRRRGRVGTGADGSARRPASPSMREAPRA